VTIWGFHLDRGSIEDGTLTCHCFDPASGCTFDLWADDVPTCAVELRRDEDEIWTLRRSSHDAGGYRSARAPRHNPGDERSRVIAGNPRSNASAAQVIERYKPRNHHNRTLQASR